jgi:aspartyl-tRNA(Asn)/glutamyl-tRNA(Gln) amidotransferase subunit B
MIFISNDKIEQMRSALPELPDKKYERYTNELAITAKNAELLTKYKKVSEYFEAVCEYVKEPGTVASRIVTQLFALITTEVERENWSPKTSAEQLGKLVAMIESGKLNRNLAKRVLGQMLETGCDAEDFISADDLSGFSPEALAKLCEEIVKREQKTVTDYRSGKEKAMKALVGAIMRETKGRANAVEAEKLLKSLIIK